VPGWCHSTLQARVMRGNLPGVNRIGEKGARRVWLLSVRICELMSANEHWPRENPGSVSTAAAEDLLVAEPILRAAQQRQADIPTYFQLRPAILDRKKTFVCLAALGVEYGASRPGIAVLLQIP
jgi:hypothetical protein